MMGSVCMGWRLYRLIWMTQVRKREGRKGWKTVYLDVKDSLK
jgi:hypothetical protein